tara:strand:+ start:8416 stop:9426 length:1011 start_codon:yes stop_codon:yes gene_type:complete
VRYLISLSNIKNKNIFLITHSGADVDAIASAGALSLILEENNSVQIAVPEHIAIPAKKLAKKAGINYKISPNFGQADTIILLDFNSWDMVGGMAPAIKAFSGKKYLVDHHTKSSDQLVPSKNTWVEAEAVATCIMIYNWAKSSKIALGKEAAALLAAGITADSAHFLIADANTFLAMSELLRMGENKFSQILEFLRVERDFSEKIAMLKAAKRSRIFKLGNFIAVISEVGAFEADSANALIRIGADLAFAGNSENNELKISGRASQSVQKKAGLDLAKDVFQPLGKFFEGSGGGHAGAAGFNGKNASASKALLKCVELSKKSIARKVPKLQLKEYT